MSVRVVIVGVGGIAEYHLGNFSELKDELQLVGVCDLDAARVEHYAGLAAEKLGSKPAVYTDLATMLQKERPDCAYVCVPPFAHGEIERTLIRHEIPFFVQKPVALDLDLALEVIDGVRRAGLITGVGYQLRYAEGVGAARSLVSERTISMAVVNRLGGLPGVGWYPIQARSGGQLVEQATHQVDLLRYIVGEIEQVWAAAATRVINREHPERDIFDVNGMALRFAGGAIGTFANSVAAQGIAPSGLNGLFVLCEDLSLTWGGGLKIKRRGQAVEEVPDGAFNTACDGTFLRAVAAGDGTQVRSPYADGAKTLAVTLAAERSARTGEVQNLLPDLERIAKAAGA